MPERCSSLDRRYLCPGSGAEPDILIDDDSDDARFGRIVHAVLADSIRRQLEALAPIEPFLEDAPSLAPHHVRGLAWAGLKWWNSRGLNPIVVEDELTATLPDGQVLVGHPDAIGRREDFDLEIPDWKCGLEREHGHQLRGYALQAFEREPQAQKAYLVTFYLREWEGVVEVVTREEVMRWSAELCARLAESYFHAGDHCEFCPTWNECPKRHAESRSAILDLAPQHQELTMPDFGKLAPAKMAELYRKRQFLGKVLEAFDSALSQHVPRHGTLSLGDGWELTRGERVKDTLDPRKVLERLDLEDLLDAGALSVSKPKVLGVVSEQTPEGKTKKAAREQFMDELRKAGGFTTKISHPLKLRKELKEEE